MVAIVYLARHAEGNAPCARFVESYKKHPAGIKHDLIVIYKGFSWPSELAEARAVFDVPHTAIQIADKDFDIASYMEAVKQLPHEYFVFFNTFTAPTADGWLAKFCAYARQDVGIAGALGSYESTHSTIRLIYKFQWLHYRLGLPCSPELRKAFAYYVDLVIGAEPPSSRSSFFASYADAFFPVQWVRHRRNNGMYAWAAPFPKFPNPHVRTTAFMVRRDLLPIDQRFTKKMDTLHFESGYEGITARMLKEGLRAIVVGKDRGYDVHEWADSKTFRLHGQENLIASDTHSRMYDAWSPEERRTSAHLSWGEYAHESPILGERFKRSEEIVLHEAYRRFIAQV